MFLPNMVNNAYVVFAARCFRSSWETSLALCRKTQVWYGNLSCVKALVGGGARPSQRNRLGFTPREGVANARPTLDKGGRLPKTLRHTLEYLEHVEVSWFAYR